MLSLILVHLALAQAPELRTPVAVVITSKRPGAEQVTPKITQRVLDSFKREGVSGLLDDSAASKELKVAGFSDPKSCQGTRACLRKLAVLLGAKAVVVGVDVGKVGKTLAIHLEAVSADKDEPLASLDVSSSVTGWSDAMSAPIVVFVRDVKAGLELKKALPPPPPPPQEVAKDDAPRKTDLKPGDVKRDPVADAVKTDTKPVSVPGIVLAGGAVASAGVAVAFAVISTSAKAQFDASVVTLPDGTKGTTLPQTQAEALAAQANTGGAVAIGTGVLALGLGVASAVLFLKN